MTNRCQLLGLQLSEVAVKDVGQGIVRLPWGLQLSEVAVKCRNRTLIKEKGTGTGTGKGKGKKETATTTT